MKKWFNYSVGGGGCLRLFVLLICILILVHMSSVLFSNEVDPDNIPNPEDGQFNPHIQSNFNDTIIVDPATLSGFLRVTRVTTVTSINRGDQPIVDLLSLWGNHQSNVVSCYPNPKHDPKKDPKKDSRSIDAWLQFKAIVPSRDDDGILWCSEFTRFSNCEFVSQFAYFTLIKQIKHFFVKEDTTPVGEAHDHPTTPTVVLEGLNKSIVEGWETLAMRVKPIFEKYRDQQDQESRIKINEILIDLLRVGTLRSVGSSIPIGHLSSIYIQGEQDVYKKNGVPLSDPDLIQAAFNLLFVVIVYDSSTMRQYKIYLSVDREALKQYLDVHRIRSSSVSYWTGKFMEFTRTKGFMAIVTKKIQEMGGIQPEDHQAVMRIMILSMESAEGVTRSNSAFTVGCKGTCMLFHYRNRSRSTGAIVTSKIVIPPRLFHNAHDGIVGCSGPLSSVEPQSSSTSIYKLYPTFQVPTRDEVSHVGTVSEGYNIVNFKCNAISSDFFYPPEYVHDMVDFVIGPSQGQTQSGSLERSGVLTQDVVSPQDTLDSPPPAPPIFDDPDDPDNIPNIVKSLNAEEEEEAVAEPPRKEEAVEEEEPPRKKVAVADTKKSSGPMSFCKSIWRKFLDILPIYTIGFERRSETNFIDGDDGDDFNKMFIRFALEICDEIESYVKETGNYKFATHHALATAKDLFQVCLPPPRPRIPADGSAYTRNWNLASNILSNVCDFITSRQHETNDLLALAIFTAHAIAYIYIDSTVGQLTTRPIIVMFNVAITSKTIGAFADVGAKEQLVSEVRDFLLRDASPEEEHGGGRRRTRRTLRRVSRKRYKKILTCPRRSRRRGSHRRRSRRRGSRRSYKIVAK